MGEAIEELQALADSCIVGCLQASLYGKGVGSASRILGWQTSYVMFSQVLLRYVEWPLFTQLSRCAKRGQEAAG